MLLLVVILSTGRTDVNLGLRTKINKWLKIVPFDYIFVALRF